MGYTISIRISNTNDNEALATLTHLKDNYAGKLLPTVFISNSKEVISGLTPINFSEAVAFITALKNQFSDRLMEYDLNYNEE